MRVGTGIIQYRMQLTFQVENHVELLIFQIFETLAFAVDRVRLDLGPKVFAVSAITVSWVDLFQARDEPGSWLNALDVVPSLWMSLWVNQQLRRSSGHRRRC